MYKNQERKKEMPGFCSPFRVFSYPKILKTYWAPHAQVPRSTLGPKHTDFQ